MPKSIWLTLADCNAAANLNIDIDSKVIREH